MASGRVMYTSSRLRPAFCRGAASHLDAQCLDKVGAVRAARKVAEVELNLVPAVVKAHGHGADERLDACAALVVGRAEPPLDILVVKHLE